MYGSKKWNIKTQDDSLVKKLSEALGTEDITSRLLINRGYSDVERASAFINKSDSFLYDPFLMKNMDKAVRRIKKAIDKKEKITIYGDYDVDGITSVSVLYMYLREKCADVDYYIPSRDTDGYGLGKDGIDNVFGKGTNLIITVDNGITAVEETKYIKSLGMDIVITDHHKCPDVLPDADAVVNPHMSDCPYPFKDLAGVGVVFKLVCAEELYINGKENNYDIDIVKQICKKYIDIVTIGTIADVMPLVEENRIIVYMGLKMLERTENNGIKALFEATGLSGSGKNAKKITSSSIAYTIAPKINASGRIGDAGRGVKLLLSESKEEAEILAEEFCSINTERQKIESEIVSDAICAAENGKKYENDSVMVISGESWHHGVIGIAASRIAEKYARPCVLISFDGCEKTGDENEDIGRGSARSVPGFDITKAFSSCSDILEKFGGHELAAGCSVKRKNLSELSRRLNEYASSLYAGEKPELALDIDAKIDISDVSLQNIDDMMRLEPFGAENPQPLFYIENVKIKDIVSLSLGKHTKMLLSSDYDEKTALFFGTDLTIEGFKRGDIISVAANLSINEFRGERTPQILCRDIKLSQAYHDELIDSEKYYEDVLAGDVLINVNDIPKREDFAVIYKFLCRIFPRGGGTVPLKRVAEECEESYIKILCTFRVFYEAGLMTYDKIPEYNYRIKLIPAEGKSDLSKTELMKKILHLNSETKF